MSDDYAGDISTTGVVNAGGLTTGNIETDGDTDWFRITLPASGAYRFDLEGRYDLEGNDLGQDKLRDPILNLYDSSGNLIPQENYGIRDGYVRLDSGIIYTALAGET